MKGSGSTLKLSKTILCLFIGILLIAAFILTFWDTIVIYVMPQTVVKDALLDAYDHLETRFREDPLTVVMDYLDPEGKQSADVHLIISGMPLGETIYDLQVGIRPHSVFTEGEICQGDKRLDVSLYMDGDYMAISSDDLTAGQFYGITYDSFHEDIRSVPLLSWMVGERILQSWEASVEDLRETMGNTHSVPVVPHIYKSDLRKLVAALAVLTDKVEKTAIAVGGEIVDCYRISGSFSGQKIQEMLSQVVQLENATDASAEVALYILGKTLYLADISIEAGESQLDAQLEMDCSLVDEPITFRVMHNDQGKEMRMYVRSSMASAESEHLVQCKIQKSDEQNLEFAYNWNPETEYMHLTVNKESADIHLEKREDGLLIESNDFSELYDMLTLKEASFLSSNSITGSILIRKGAAFSAPDYKNLDQWSMEDFWILAEGIGSFVGQNII